MVSFIKIQSIQNIDISSNTFSVIVLNFYKYVDEFYV